MVSLLLASPQQLTFDVATVKSTSPRLPNGLSCVICNKHVLAIFGYGGAANIRKSDPAAYPLHNETRLLPVPNNTRFSYRQDAVEAVWASEDTKSLGRGFRV